MLAPLPDVPFGLNLTTIVVDLPRPPSLNHIWKFSRKGVRPSTKYETWKRAADGLAMLQRIHRGNHPIGGQFEAVILVADGKRGDLDNLGKAVLDWAQSRNLISNDKHCRKLTLEFVEPERAPRGAKLTLRELAA